MVVISAIKGHDNSDTSEVICGITQEIKKPCAMRSRPPTHEQVFGTRDSTVNERAATKQRRNKDLEQLY